MEKTQPDFVYISYIRTTPEKLWNALINPEITQLYFMGVAFETDWNPGSPLYTHPQGGEKKLWGTVKAFEPPRLLAYTFDGPAHGPKPHRATLATFEMQPHGDGVRLYLTHSQLTPEDVDSRKNTFHGLNNGWPAILSGLKSFLETGESIRLEDMNAQGEYGGA